MQKSFVRRTLLVFVVIATSLILFQAGSVSSALGSGSDWIIAGDCVYWNNSKGDVRVCPHTLQGSGWAYFNVTSYLPASFDLDLAFGISENIVASKPQIWRNFSHPVFVSNCTASTQQILNNGTPQNITTQVCNPYYWEDYYFDWQNVGGFSTLQYDEKTWYVRGATWDAGETKSGRVWLDVKPMSGKSKYSVFLKKASDTFAQAEASGNYVLLDPWVDTSPTVFNETFDNGAFLNGTWGNLNISRGYLILNLSGGNTTDILFNSSAVGGQNCWNSSADPSSSGTDYNCRNLIKTPGNPFTPSEIWAAVDTSVPQWVAYELDNYYWLYNFTYDKGFDTQNGRNPANWSVQVPSGNITRANPNGPGADNSTDWTFAQFNSTNSAGDAPSVGGFVFGPVRAKWLRFYVSNQNAVGNQVYLESLHATRVAFNLSGQKLSVLLNDTVVIAEVNATCINTTGSDSSVGMNITVMDKNFANEQTIQCKAAEDGLGFQNMLATPITGLIYRINFSSKHSEVTPELDYLTLRIKTTIVASVPFVNVSVLNGTSSNVTAVLASEQLFSNANYSHVSNIPEGNSTFKWFINSTNQSWSGGNRTAEMVPIIYKGAVAYWHFDSVNGSNVTLDSIGYGNHGKLLAGFNQSNASTTGITLSGLVFDGTSNYVDAGTGAVLSSPLTASAWIKPRSLHTSRFIQSSDDAVGQNGYSIDTINDGTIHVFWGVVGGTGDALDTVDTYPVGSWTHVAFAHNGTWAGVYLNGVLKASKATAVPIVRDTGAPLRIGGHQDWFFNGSIDEVTIYNRSLSQSEIVQLYQRAWYDVSPEALLWHADNSSSALINATDAGSHLPRATLVNGVNCTAAVTGVYGTACQFDGNNDYVNLGNSESLNIYGDLTAEMWVYLYRVGVYQELISRFGDVVNGYNSPYEFRITSANQLQFCSSNATSNACVSGNGVLAANRWNYVAVTRAGTSISFYINGTLDATGTRAVPTGSTAITTVGLRAPTLDPWSPLDGKVDELRISRKALTAQEINLSYSKGRAFFQNEYLLNSSNYEAGDALKLEYTPKDSTGVVGAVRNSSGLNVHAPLLADEQAGDVAVEKGINSSLISAMKYSSQQVYVTNLNNNQTLGTFDWVASYGSQRWLFNYVTAGESYVNAPNLITAVYVLEITGKTTNQITDEVSRLINSTKS